MNYWRPKIIGARVIEEMGVLPKGYGIAWWLPYSHAAYCLPIPINKIVGSFRNWWLQWRRPCEDDPIAGAYTYGYEEGLVAGRKQGRESEARLFAILAQEYKREIQEIRKLL